MGEVLAERLIGAHALWNFREDGETSLSASQSPDFESEVRECFEAMPDMIKSIKKEGPKAEVA